MKGTYIFKPQVQDGEVREGRATMPATRSIPLEVWMEHQHVDCQLTIFHGRPTNQNATASAQVNAGFRGHSCGEGQAGTAS